MPKAQTEPVGLHQRVSPFGGEMIAAMTFPEGCKINRERPYLPGWRLSSNSIVCVQFVANCRPHSHYVFVPRVGMVAQSMRLLSHVLRRAPNRGRRVLVVVAGEPLNSSGPPVVPTSLRDRAAQELEKLADSVVGGPGARRRDFHRSGSVRRPGSRSVGMEVTVSAGPLPSTTSSSANLLGPD